MIAWNPTFAGVAMDLDLCASGGLARSANNLALRAKLRGLSRAILGFTGGTRCWSRASRSRRFSRSATALFTRIVPTIKEIELWGPRIRKADADMGILGFADVDGEELARQDESIAERFDKQRAKHD